jgi:hypothetical protein
MNYLILAAIAVLIFYVYFVGAQICGRLDSLTGKIDLLITGLDGMSKSLIKIENTLDRLEDIATDGDYRQFE